MFSLAFNTFHPAEWIPCSSHLCSCHAQNEVLIGELWFFVLVSWKRKASQTETSFKPTASQRRERTLPVTALACSWYRQKIWYPTSQRYTIDFSCPVNHYSYIIRPKATKDRLVFLKQWIAISQMMTDSRKLTSQTKYGNLIWINWVQWNLREE